jgi:hypothetical protein
MQSTLSKFTFLAALLLSGCATTYEPVSKEYTGPTASLRDTGFSEDWGKAQMFSAVEIDGNRVMNAFWASRNASQGQGNLLSTVYPERKVKAAPMKVTLRGSHTTGAPIAAIASQMAGTFFSVEGVVDFAPRPDGKYIVKGELKKEKSTVWIEDVETGNPVTAILSK